MRIFANHGHFPASSKKLLVPCAVVHEVCITPDGKLAPLTHSPAVSHCEVSCCGVVTRLLPVAHSLTQDIASYFSL